MALSRDQVSRRVSLPILLLVALAIATTLGLGVAASSSTTAFDPYNPSWDGSSEFVAMADDDPSIDLQISQSTAGYDDVDPAETTSFIIAPTEPYGEDADAITDFLAEGGTVVVFDNVETGGNELLEQVGASARIDGKIVRDEEANERGPLMPVASNATTHERTAGVDQITLNYASGIEPGDATVLVETSEYAYLVEDPETTLEDEDDVDLSATPVVTIESVGNGEVVVVSDPSITTNAMLTEPDNTAFLEAQYDGEETLLLDHSHTADFPPLSSLLLTIRSSTGLQGALGLLAVGLVLATITGHTRHATRGISRRLGQTFQRKDRNQGLDAKLSNDEWETLLRRRHPDWDEAKVQRVIAALNRTDAKRGDNE